MTKEQQHKDKLFGNKLSKIENRLRRMEILLLKNNTSNKSIKKEMQNLEKEEKIIEQEQKKLEKEEKEILKEMKFFENEEKWHIEVQYNCKSKIMDDSNIIKCAKTSKLCDFRICPLWKKK
jgi:hypothetical protein